MGGVDDNEPPTKRVKASSIASDHFAKNSSLSESICSLGGSMARSLPSQEKEEMIGSKGIIKRVEFVRIIAKALYSLGYEKSGAVLEEESGICLHSPMVNLFKEQVIDGRWDECLDTLHKIGILDENILKSASFLILEHKFIEFLGKNRIVDALKTLRSEISPLGIKKKRVHELSSCIVSSSQCSLKMPGNLNIEIANSRSKLLEELQKLLPSSYMIPEKRLEHLVDQALNVQKESCFLHNALDNTLSLYTDHHCGEDHIPSQTAQILQGHHDEVWFLQFSNNGNYLASTSNDRSAIIWEVNEDGKVLLKHRLTGHQKPVLMVSWSPDDQQLLSCGMEEAVRRWNVSSGECLNVYEKSGIGLISCCWLPDGKQFISGATDKSIRLWDLEGKEVDCWSGQQTIKTSDMAIRKDGRQIVSTHGETALMLLDWETRREKLIKEEQAITSFSLSRDDKFLLVNLINQEIHLWSLLDNHPKLIQKFKGHKRSRFVIRSCFGGFEQGFIASGSEDSQVYIWHRCSGDLIHALAGHAGAVNCVSWNPINPHMLASASDDHTVRIWGLSKSILKPKESFSNGGLHLCNGNSRK